MKIIHATFGIIAGNISSFFLDSYIPCIGADFGLYVTGYEGVTSYKFLGPGFLD